MGKSIDTFTQEIRKRKWTELLVSCNSSGQSRSEWCKENGINLKTFYYWQHKLKSETIELSESHAIGYIIKKWTQKGEWYTIKKRSVHKWKISNIQKNSSKV